MGEERDLRTASEGYLDDNVLYGLGHPPPSMD